MEENSSYNVSIANNPISLAMSEKMQDINQQALNKARAFIAKKFKDPIDLDDISVIHFQLRKQFKAAEVQLNGALQTKLDALKRSVDLMDESTSRLDELTNHMKIVDEKINNANTLICKYDKLKRVHNARENLNKVINQTEFFARVPEKVDELRELLDNDPEKLKDVYLEAVKLDALRVGMMKELKRHETANTTSVKKVDKKSSKPIVDNDDIDDLDKLIIGDDDDDNDDDKNNDNDNVEEDKDNKDKEENNENDEVEEEGGDDDDEQEEESKTPIIPDIPVNRRGSMDYSAETNNRVKKIVEAQLRSIPMLMRDIRGKLFFNMERMWFVGYDGTTFTAADLVETFEIMRMHQEYLNRTALQRMKIHEEYGFKEEVFNIGPESLKKMRMIIEEKIEGIFENPQFRKQAEKGQKVSEIGIVLDAANQILQTLTEFKQVVLQCIPSEYGFMKMYVSIMEDQLLFRITSLTSNTDQLDVGEILRFVDWVDFYSMQMDIYEEDLAVPLKASAILDKGIKLIVIDKGEYNLLPAIVVEKNDGKALNVKVTIGEKELEIERRSLAMPRSRDLCLTFSAIADDMLTDYLQRMKQQIMGWFGNIKKQKIEVLSATDNTLMTSTPEDMFNIIQMQLQVATEQLPKKYLKDVMNACLSVLREFQRMAYDQLALAEEMLYKPKVEVEEKDAKKKNKGGGGGSAVTDEFAAYNSQLTDPETLCAIINDTQRMQEKSSELSSRLDQVPKMIDGKSFEMDIEMLSASLEELEHGYIDLAVQQVRFLARAVCEDLEEEVFLKIYEPDWEAGGKFVDIIVATLNDYLPDLEEWLQEYFYNKLLRELLVILVGKYIMALRKKPDSFRFKNHLTAGKRITADKDTLVRFFEGYADSISRGGKTDVIKEEFESLTCLFKIVVMLDLPDNDTNIKKLYEKWGADGRALVLAAINSNPQTANDKKSAMTERALKMFEKGNYNDDLSVMYKTELEEARIKAAREKDGKKTSFFGKKKS